MIKSNQLVTIDLGKMDKLTNTTNKLIYISYLALAIFTPILMTTKTTEIYEVPKMLFVYLAATIIFFATLFKFTLEKKITLPINLPATAFGIFLLTQIVSTITSTDSYTSIFGYPTRLNGGLLSSIAYFILFTAALINLNAAKVKNVLLATIFTAVTVSLWGIPSHFGRDPSCFVLVGKLTSGCWQKEFDPTLRIFSTFGQPNWLASYLVLVLPIAIALTLILKKQQQIIFALSSILIFWALILTNSRAGLLGLIISLLILVLLIGAKTLKSNIKILTVLSIAFLIITFSFANTITSRIKDTLSVPDKKTATITRPEPPSSAGQSSLTSGGTESGQIRLIVWHGAIDIFKNWPFLGPGPETFVNTYYQFRPPAQNQTTEWEFFYNKAHNEFLNYLSTSGIIGFLAFVFLCFTILFPILKSTSEDVYKTSFQKASQAAIIGYLTTIFFGFSTVATQTTLITIAFSTIILSGNLKFKTLGLKYIVQPFYNKIQTALVIITFTYCLTTVARIYFADALAKRAQDSTGAKSLLAYKNAITTTPLKNPYLLADFAYNSALYAQNLENPKNRQTIAEEINSSAQLAYNLSPHSYLITQKIAKTYMLLMEESPQFTGDARFHAQRLTQLAPSYPPAYLTYAKFLTLEGELDFAKIIVTNALSLKPDYQEAIELQEQLETKKPRQLEENS